MTSATKSVNFYRIKSKDYAKVQDNLFGEIQRHLPADGFTEQKELIDSASANNLSLFLRHKADVVMSHGVADKNYLFMKDEKKEPYLNRFKHVLVPGPWLKQRLVADSRIQLGEEQVHCVGWPRNDFLLRLVKKRSKKDDADVPKATRVLWAPTHDMRKRGPEQESTSSYPAFDQYSSLLSTKYEYNASLHPRSRASKKPTAELLVDADVVISDFGTLVYEAWSLGKPVIFPRWLLKDRIIQYTPHSAEAHIFEKNLGYHPQSIDELIDMIESGPVVGDEVKEFMELYLPSDTFGRSGKMIADLLRTLP